MSDKNIIKSLMKMDKKYSDLSRNKYRGTARDKVNQGEFISFLNKLFWIGSTDLKNQIRKDKKRSDKDKHDDLPFLEDQEGPRHFSLGSEDRKFSKKVLCCF